MFEIRFEPEDRLLCYSMRGFWTLATIASFRAALHTTLAGIETSRSGFDCLNDARAFPVQSAEVSAALGVAMTLMLNGIRGRIAVAVGSRLNKIQAERTIRNPSARVFLSIEEARAWLKAPPDLPGPSSTLALDRSGHSA